MLKRTRAMVAGQCGKHILTNYQLCCLNSFERLYSHDHQCSKKPLVPPDNEERKQEQHINDPLVLTVAKKLTFGIDTLAFLHQLPDLKWATIKEWRKKSLERQQVLDQKFIPERLRILGSDLAAAHFIVHRGGAVKFKDQIDWIQKDKEGYKLPSKFVPNLYLEAIDASQTGLLYEGFQNLEHLYYLKSLNLSHCDCIDDWCLDRLHIFKESLEHLDISGCINITERGLSSLYRLSNLKTLNLANMPNVSHLHLVCLLLEDILPECQILGVDYTDVKIQEDESIVKENSNEKIQKFPL